MALGFNYYYPSKSLAEIVYEQAVEIAQLKEANATAQKRLGDKQAVVDAVCKYRDELLAEVAKLKGDLAQADSGELLCEIGNIAKGFPGVRDFASNAYIAVRKLRADYDKLQNDIKDKVYLHKVMDNPRYEARLHSIACCAQGSPHEPADGWAYQAVKKLRDDLDKSKMFREAELEPLQRLATDAPAGACLVLWAADEIEVLRRRLNAWKDTANVACERLAKVRLAAS